MNTREIGRTGEKIASNFLINNGIKIINKNYFTKYGEIDLIGIENRTIIFIEVKLRNQLNFGFPCESIDDKKIKKIQESANYFLITNYLLDYECRFDVISIIFDGKCNGYKINWLKNQLFY